MNSPPAPDPPWLLRVDTGGTFTDGWARSPEGEERRCKVLSSGVLRTRVEERIGTGCYRLAGDFGVEDGLLQDFAIHGGGVVSRWRRKGRLLTVEGGRTFAEGELLDLFTGEEAPVLAARLLTSTPLGSPFPIIDFRLATTRATNALLERRGSEGVLIVTEGFEDLLRIRDQRRPHLFKLDQELPVPVFQRAIGIRERISATGKVIEHLDEEEVAMLIECLHHEAVEVVAVALLNSYANPVHEKRLGKLLREAGIRFVSLSTELASRMRFLPRAETAAANAYLAPVMDRFVAAVGSRLGEGSLELLTSAGFLKEAKDYRPVDSLLSGPAGGVVGALSASRAAGHERILAFDMGGTSTDVARLEGAPSFRYEQAIGPVRVVAPAVRIETVAAGGGSICRWRNGGMEVGPESAGADPGPACYGRGGPLTITDVNLLLGCMETGKAGIPLEVGASQDRFESLKKQMQRDGVELAPDQDLLEGLREIAVERMAEAIRKVSLREGYDPGDYLLVAFGGAGPQHACAVAEKLGISEILVPGDAGLLSAWGLHRSVRESIAERQILRKCGDLERGWSGLLCELAGEARDEVGETAEVSRYLCELRLWGQDSSLELEYEVAPTLDEVRAAFHAKYEVLYGYGVPRDREVEVVAVRVVAAGPLEEQEIEEFAEPEEVAERRGVRQDSFRTCVVEPGWRFTQGSKGSLKLARVAEPRRSAEWAPEVEAELFRCRFESVVEEMGELLRRSAISTNVKERLDYSCALLDGEGRLVVNAPHIPVHLGALGECVRKVSRGHAWQEGDMVAVNHPGFGGSHLPDVTLISPVFSEGALVAFVANRAHHAEIGGRTPGSMPAEATSLEEEGVVIAPVLLFEGGRDRFAEVKDLFQSAACPSRMLSDNLADLAAQAAANRHGVKAVQSLVADAGQETVIRNMVRLYERAAAVMADKLQELGERTWRAADSLDDGTVIEVKITSMTGCLHIDFAGSGPVHPGNLNATPSIVRSAVLYVLRAWVALDLPLNEGLLEGVQIEIPPGILNPEFPDDPSCCPAVVGGNVETSQRVVDVLLEALGVQANSQGTMNNVLFGNEDFGYYETIGGGSGAGPGWNGLSGTHVHMSNTAITDPEILEHRFPVRLREFSLRRGSGGEGRWRGGDGLLRDIEFTEPMTVSLLTQRRETAPRGAEGGGDGVLGRQVLIRPDGSSEVLPAVHSFEVRSGERLRIETPGGGGWGEPD